MKKVLVLLLLVGGSQISHAQMGLVKKAAQVAPVAGKVVQSLSAGSALTQLAGGLMPSAFNSQWSGAKNNWMSKASKVTSAVQSAQMLGQLVGFMKPDAFKSGWSPVKSGFMSKLGSVTTMSGLGSSMSGLLGNVNDNAMTGEFQQNRGTFLNALSLLK